MSVRGIELTERIDEAPDGLLRVEYRVRSNHDASGWLLLHRPGATQPDVTFIPEVSFRKAVAYVSREQLSALSASLAP